MFDIGAPELFVIAVVLIVVVGPKDLPAMLRTFGRMVSKLRGMAGEFRSQFDEALREAELDEVRKAVSDVQKLNPTTAMREAMDPFRKANDEMKRTLKDADRSTPERSDATVEEDIELFDEPMNEPPDTVVRDEAKPTQASEAAR